jgi:hypothetical protein
VQPRLRRSVASKDALGQLIDARVHSDAQHFGFAVDSEISIDLISKGPMSVPALKPVAASSWWITRTVALSAALLAAALIMVRPGGAETPAAAAPKSGSSQGLWVVNSGFIAEFQGNSLTRGKTPKPNLALGFSDCCPTFNGLAFDQSGNLWIAFIASPGGGQIGELTSDELKRGKKGKLARHHWRQRDPVSFEHRVRSRRRPLGGGLGYGQPGRVYT